MPRQRSMEVISAGGTAKRNRLLRPFLRSYRESQIRMCPGLIEAEARRSEVDGRESEEPVSGGNSQNMTGEPRRVAAASNGSEPRAKEIAIIERDDGPPGNS